MSTVSLDPYADHLASVRAFCNKLVKDGVLPLQQAGNPVVDFDSFGDDEELPPGDLIGPASFMLDVDEHLISVTVMVGICTQKDTNSNRLNKAVSELLKRLLPTKKIPVIRATDGENLGTMAVGKNVRVLPVSGRDNRNMKFIAVELHSTVTLDFDSSE